MRCLSCLSLVLPLSLCLACSGGEIDSQDDGGLVDLTAVDAPADVAPVDLRKETSTPPADSGNCPKLKVLAGTYSGTFKGTITALGPSSGTVTFTLLQVGADEFLTIKTGKMSGKVKDLIPYSSDLAGTVKCGVMQAKIENGKSGSVDFKGTMKATYKSAGFTGGTWTVTYISGGALGSGTWQAVKK